MTKADIVQDQIRIASPLTMAKTLAELELYDKKEAQEIIDEVYKKFDSGDHLTDNLLKPVVLSVADGVLELKMFSPMRKKGLTASRIYEECSHFTYDSKASINEIDGYTEYKSMRDEIGYDADYTTSHNRNSALRMGDTAKKIFGNDTADKLNDANYSDMYNNNTQYQNPDMSQEYDRKKVEDKRRMNEYKEKKFEGKDRTKDEYDFLDELEHTGEGAQTDHIIPAEKVHEQFHGNMALNDEDLKIISNDDNNFALTSGPLNKSKGSKLNEDFEKFHGEPLPDHVKETMKTKSEIAQEHVNNAANKAVRQTLTFQGNVKITTEDRARIVREKKRLEAQFEKEHGRKPKREERIAINSKAEEKITKNLQVKKAVNTYKSIGDAAVSQSKDFAIGNLVLCLLKPIYYEVHDIFKNGLKAKGLNASSNIDAIKLRFKRVKDYIFSHIKEIVQGNLTDFIKSLVSSFIEGIIDCFVGMVKKAIKIVKEGIKIFVKAYKILWGKDGEGLTDRQKWDAVIKMIGASIGILAGIGIEAILQSFAIPKVLLVPVSTFLGGVITAVFMYVLDKADLFSTKSEQRRNAIIKIFDARIAEIKGATEAMNTSAIEVLNEQRKCYDNISEAMKKAINTKNYVELNSQLFVMAKFFNIELPYSSSDEFVKHYDSVRELVLN